MYPTSVDAERRLLKNHINHALLVGFSARAGQAPLDRSGALAGPGRVGLRSPLNLDLVEHQQLPIMTYSTSEHSNSNVGNPVLGAVGTRTGTDPFDEGISNMSSMLQQGQ